MIYPPGDRPEELAHKEDSLALAEHLTPADLEASLAAIGNSTAPSACLARAWTYDEYALATPETEQDAEMFRLSRTELEVIIGNPDLGPRHPIKLQARKLLEYEDAFRQRAASEPVTKPIRRTLQQNLGVISLEFLGDDDLSNEDFGQLSELVALMYLLDGKLFPYLSSLREEANMIQADNHDYYTLHTVKGGGVKKAPASVKYRIIPEKNDLVILLSLDEWRSMWLAKRHHILKTTSSKKESPWAMPWRLA